MNHSNSRNGFTLVEALVVVGITVMLASVLIVNSRSSKEQITFFREQSLLTSSVLRAKSFSVETFQPAFQPCPGCQQNTNPTERICGWGISFDKNASPNRYVLFRDLAPSGATSCGGAAGANGKYDVGEEFEIFTLDPQVVLDSLCFQPITGCSNTMDILFVPPDPVVTFFGASPNDIEANIVIKLQSTLRQTTLKISRSGQVTSS